MQKKFFLVIKFVCIILKIMENFENQYDLIPLIATPSSRDWDMATFDSLVYILPFF